MKTGINDHRLRFGTVAAITLAGVVAGCGNGIPQEAQPRTPVANDQDSSTNSSAATEAPESTESTDPAPTTIPPVDLPADRAAVFADLARFWSANADAMGVSEIPSIDMDRVQPWRQDAILCEEESILVEDVAANAAAFACTEGGAIVWDDGLLAEIADNFGSATTYGVFAHEYGHYVAWLVDPEGEDIWALGVRAEQFADCAEGAWVADARRRAIPQIPDDDALGEIAGSIWAVSDLPEEDVNSVDAHGTAFDRLYAFYAGYDGGVAACSAFQTATPVLAAHRIVNNGAPAITPETSDQELEDLAAEVVEEFGKVPQPLEGIKAKPNFLEIVGSDELRPELGDGWQLTNVAVNSIAARQEADGGDAFGHEEIIFQGCWNAAMLGWLTAGKSASMSMTTDTLDSAITSIVAFTDPEQPAQAFDILHHLRAAFEAGPTYCKPA